MRAIPVINFEEGFQYTPAIFLVRVQSSETVHGHSISKSTQNSWADLTAAAQYRGHRRCITAGVLLAHLLGVIFLGAYK